MSVSRPSAGVAPGGDRRATIAAGPNDLGSRLVPMSDPMPILHPPPLPPAPFDPRGFPPVRIVPHPHPSPSSSSPYSLRRRDLLPRAIPRTIQPITDVTVSNLGLGSDAAQVGDCERGW